MSSRIFETYKNCLMLHGCHIYQTASDMAIATMCVYPPSRHALPHWKFVLHCCYNCPCIAIQIQKYSKNHSHACPRIRVYAYKMASRCKVHGQRSTYGKVPFMLSYPAPQPAPTAKIYTSKELVILYTSLAGFHTSFYIS